MQGAAAAGIEVDAIAGGRGRLEGEARRSKTWRLEAGLAQAVGEGEAAEAGAGDEDAQRHQ